MISCTEFIPAYSELFKFIDKKSGRQAVYDYWHDLFQPEKSPLNGYLDKYGLRGCWEYWTVIHIEEACDATMLFNEEEGWWFSCLHSCPSKGRFTKLGYLEPFEDYCHHCDGYEYSAAKHGFVNVQDYRGSEKACCRQMIYDPKRFKGDPQKMMDALYECEMSGCKAETTGCPFDRNGSLKLTTTSEAYKYLHREFHESMNRGAKYVAEHYGEEGLKEYLNQFTDAFHVPTIQDIRNRGLDAVSDYLSWLYRTEEASDAISMVRSDKELAVTVRYCPAVRYLRSGGNEVYDTFGKCTEYVYARLAEVTGLGFEMLSYDDETGAAEFRFTK